MTEVSNSATDPYLSPELSKKLRAARATLGDKLCTHPASRFKPAKLTLLDEWLVMRRAAAVTGGASDRKAEGENPPKVRIVELRSRSN
jgi:hypothetical protein